MLKRIATLLKHRRRVRTALSTLSHLYGEGDGSLDALGGLTDAELSGLVSWLPVRGRFVEIGTLFGLTARAVALARPELKIVAVDDFSWNPFGLPPDVHEAFARRILSDVIKRGQVELRAVTSEEFRNAAFQRPADASARIDAIFFDADHRYEPVKDELAWAKQAGIPIIAGHDYGNPNPHFGVTRAVDEIFGRESVEVIGQCWAHLAI